MKQLFVTAGAILMVILTHAQTPQKVISFENGETALSSAGKTALDHLMVNGIVGTWVEVSTEGFLPLDSSNRYLNDCSLRRAQAVRDHMKSRGTFPDNIFLSKRHLKGATHQRGTTPSFQWIVRLRVNKVRIPGMEPEVIPQFVVDNREKHDRFDELIRDPFKRTIDPRKATEFRCPQGTRISFEAKSFDTKEKVIIVVNEYYRKSDILLAQLSTRSWDAQLESGGMVHIMAYEKEVKPGNEIDLAPGVNYQIEFKRDGERKDDMLWFNGEEDEELSADVNWVLPSVDENWDDWESEEYYEGDLLSATEQGVLDGVYLAQSKADGYLLSGNDFGWINCDRFYEVPDSDKVPYQVNLSIEWPDTAKNRSANLYPAVRMVFNDIKSVMPGHGAKTVSFSPVPADHKVTIVAYVIVGKQPMFATLETTIANATNNPELTMKYGTWDELKRTFESLN